MSRRLLVILGVVTTTLALSILIVLQYRRTGGVYIGPYPSLTAKARGTLTELGHTLNHAQKGVEMLLSNNAALKTGYLDPLERIGANQGATPNFRLLVDGLQLENRIVKSQAELDLYALQILVSVNTGVLKGLRYEKLDPSLVTLEESFPNRDLEMSTLSDQNDMIITVLETLRLGPPNTAEVRHFGELKTICYLQGKNVDSVIAQYSKQIKVATKALRIIVDEMAAGRSKPSAPED